MTTVSDAAFDWYQEKTLGNKTAVIDTVAVGDGSGSETENPSGLSNELYRNDTSVDIVEIIKTANLGQIEARITVTGGTEVPAGAQISEMMAVTSDNAVIIAVDNFADVEVSGGQSETFTMPVVIQRA